MKTSRHSNNTFYQATHSLCAWMMLLLYVAGAAQIDTLHQLVHQHTAEEIHSEQAEKDPCHRSVFHHEQKKGCEHKTHFSAVKKCSVQQLLTSTPHVQTAASVYADQHCFFDLTSVCILSFGTSTDALLPARAPPVSS